MLQLRLGMLLLRRRMLRLRTLRQELRLLLLRLPWHLLLPLAVRWRQLRRRPPGVFGPPGADFCTRRSTRGLPPARARHECCEHVDELPLILESSNRRHSIQDPNEALPPTQQIGLSPASLCPRLVLGGRSKGRERRGTDRGVAVGRRLEPQRSQREFRMKRRPSLEIVRGQSRLRSPDTGK